METPSSALARHASLFSNLLALAVLVGGLLLPGAGNRILTNVGLFALAGGLTNWLAVHMLFERLPFFYGSGVIVRRFAAFKQAIQQLLSEQFFSSPQVERLFSQLPATQGQLFDPAALDPLLDYDGIATRIVAQFSNQYLAGLLGGLLGGDFQQQFVPAVSQTIRSTVHQELGRDDVQQQLLGTLLTERQQQFQQASQRLIAMRLAELTPQQVKRIAEQMIKEHLGWLVIWGVVCGGLLGLLSLPLR